MTYFPLRQTTCFFIPLVAPCKPLLHRHYYNKEQRNFLDVFCSVKRLCWVRAFFQTRRDGGNRIVVAEGAGFLTAAAEQTHRCAAVGAFQHIGAAVPAEVRFFQAGKTAPLPAVQNRRKLAWSVASFLSAQTLKRR